MTQALPSTIKPDRFRIRAAIGGPVGLWTSVRNRGGELSWVLSGKFGLMGANAAVMLFLANRLELQTYGLLVITISSQLLISRFLMVGVDVGMVRLTGVPELKSRSGEVVMAGLVAMAYTSCALVVVSLIAAAVLFRLGVPGWVLPCIVAGSIGTALVDYGYSFRLARREYRLAALAQGGTAIWRLVLTTLAAILLPAYSLVVIVAYHGASLLSGLGQTLITIRVDHPWPDRALISRLLRYSFWQGKANVIVIFSLYQGTFLLMFLKQTTAIAIFGVGLTLSLGFFAIYNAYFEYLLVRVRSVEDIKGLPGFIKRALGASVALVVASVPVVVAVVMLMPWLLRREWLEVIPIFVYLAASMILLILQAPFEAASHYLLKPQLISSGWLIRAVLIGAGGLILAPQIGGMGAAIAQLIGSALALIVLSLLVIGALKSAVRAEA